MRITALKQQIKNPDRVSVFVDAKYSFSLTLSQIISEKLKVGLELNDQQINDLKSKSTDEKLRLKALNWTLLRPRSTRELKDYLKRATYQKNRTGDSNEQTKLTVDDIVEDFMNRGWVNDEIFARWWIERRSRADRSRSHIKSELMGKGVSREIITEVLSEKDDSLALYVLVTKLKSKPKYADRQKLMRYLVGKGFSYSSVTDALDAGDGDSLD